MATPDVHRLNSELNRGRVEFYRQTVIAILFLSWKSYRFIAQFHDFFKNISVLLVFGQSATEILINLSVVALTVVRCYYFFTYFNLNIRHRQVAFLRFIFRRTYEKTTYLTWTKLITGNSLEHPHFVAL